MTLIPLNAANADQVLLPGDILIKLLADEGRWTSRLISLGENATQFFDSALNAAVAKGDPSAVHMALYAGDGETSEAHGGSLSTACVGMRRIAEHAGFIFEVFRPVDHELAASAVQTAKAWANGTMKYEIPVLVPLSSSSFGPEARREALIFGRDALRTGGPSGYDKMFCSQFVIAAYQAAVIAPQLRDDPNLAPDAIKMPFALMLQASHASPLVVEGLLREAVENELNGGWTFIGKIAVGADASA